MSRQAVPLSASERRIEWGTIALGAAAALFAAARMTGRAAFGVAVGTLLAWINFRWLRSAVITLEVLSKAQAGVEKPSVPREVYARFFGAFALLVAVVCASFFYSLFPGAAVVAGLFSLVAAVLVECVYLLARGRGERTD
ncbi:MAG TPA: hypothetical protein VEG63_09475 [Candidatus Acidoferrales bacterium]|nr:hypothetical protein [Candidatus Acidoferrales bacterium]